MNRKLLLTLAGAAAGAFMLYGTAQAAPAASGSLDALKTLGVEQSQIEQARCYRRCSATDAEAATLTLAGAAEAAGLPALGP
jgi:hypothetical protein